MDRIAAVVVLGAVAAVGTVAVYLLGKKRGQEQVLELVTNYADEEIMELCEDDEDLF